MDPIGLAGGLNQYVFAASDPISNDDPYGLIVRVIGSQRFKDAVQRLRERDPYGFGRDYDKLESDTATYVIGEDPEGGTEIVYGGTVWNPVTGTTGFAPRNTTPVANEEAQRLVNRWKEKSPLGSIRGLMKVGTGPDGEKIECLAVHGMIHLRGLERAGGPPMQNLGHSHPDFSRQWFTDAGCNRR